MTNLWNISAEFDRTARRVHYKIESVKECAYPSLDIILSWCKDACERLLLELKEKEADQRDLECVEKEIELLIAYQKNWKTKQKRVA